MLVARPYLRASGSFLPFHFLLLICREWLLCPASAHVLLLLPWLLLLLMAFCQTGVQSQPSKVATGILLKQDFE
jgi:hypothetical protein